MTAPTSAQEPLDLHPGASLGSSVLPEPILAAREISVAYRTSEPGRLRSVTRTFDAVSGVSITIGAGERVAVVGESGSGKTTLGRALVGLQPIRAGRIEFRGRPVDMTDRRALAAFRQHVQIVFQDPYSSLNPRMSVHTAIDRVLRVQTSLAGPARDARVRELLTAVGLPASHGSRYPHELSGGQRQRVAVARALAADPEVLIADEPTSSLDVSVQAQILGLLDELARERHLAILFVTHDFGVVRAIADRVAVMHLAEVIEEGPVASVINDPRHPYTRALLSSVPAPSHRGSPRQRLLGRPLSSARPPAGCRLHPRCPFATERCAVEVPMLRRTGAGRAVACYYSDETHVPWDADGAPNPSGH